MELLKLAFDTLVIGALALPWLWLFVRIFLYHGDGGQEELKLPFLEILPDGVKEAASGALVIAIGYFLGSAVTRISNDFFDDGDILGKLPNQSSIRLGVYLHEYCDSHSVLNALDLPIPGKDATVALASFCTQAKEMKGMVREFFRLQESRFLREGEDKTGRLRELHDQIEILRGATLNFGALFILSLFGLCALWRARPPTTAAGQSQKRPLRILLKGSTYLPALFLVGYGVWAVYHHLDRVKPSASASPAAAAADSVLTPRAEAAQTPKARDNPFELHNDPPLAEGVLILAGIAGLFIPGYKHSPRLFRGVCLMALVLTFIAYGAWWWTEVAYDQYVIHAFPANLELKSAPA